MSTRGHTRQRRLLAAMVGLGLVVAACGSDGATGDDASPATSAAGGTGDEAAPETTAAADGETTDTTLWTMSLTYLRVASLKGLLFTTIKQHL